MAFQFPGTEVYDAAGNYRVVWSPEEYAEALSTGWLAEKPAPVVDEAPAADDAPPVEPQPEPKKKKSRD